MSESFISEIDCSRVIPAICRFAKTKAMALMQIAGQKQNASGSFRRWAAYLAIAADASTAFFSWLCDRFAVRAVRSARLNRALEPLRVKRDDGLSSDVLKANAELNDIFDRWSNNSLDRSVGSQILIVELALVGLSARSVNSGVNPRRTTMHLERAYRLINLLDIPEKKRNFWPQHSIVVIERDGAIIDVIQYFRENSLEVAAQAQSKYYPKSIMFFAEPGWYNSVDDLKAKVAWALSDPTDDTYIVGKGLIGNMSEAEQNEYLKKLK
jgi:hypothetical protein